MGQDKHTHNLRIQSTSRIDAAIMRNGISDIFLVTNQQADESTDNEFSTVHDSDSEMYNIPSLDPVVQKLTYHLLK